MKVTKPYDAIVIGGGTMGLGAARALSRHGVRVLVLEQFGIVHDRGSHSGKTRIIRQAYAESPDYVPLVQRAEQLWLDLEAETGRHFFQRTGGLDLARPGYSQARDARRACEEHGIPYEWLDGAEIRRRWPAWKLDDAWEACYSPRTGFLRVDPALRALAESAERNGATIRSNEPARSWEVRSGAVEVRTDRGAYAADRLVIAAGAWSNRLLAEVGLPLTVLRKVVWWLDVDDPARFEVGAFPIFISDGPDGSIYGFPLADADGMKIADHAGGEASDPDRLERAARDDEAAHVVRFARENLNGVTDRIRERAVCMYTMTPDRDFVVDRAPDQPEVVFGAGFSGHGFKFAPAIGELLATLALDPRAAPLPRFRLSRLHRPG